jgi:hypothetical protein
MYGLYISVVCSALDWQVSSIAQISNALSQVFYMMEHLTFAHDVHGQPSEVCTEFAGFTGRRICYFLILILKRRRTRFIRYAVSSYWVVTVK